MTLSFPSNFIPSIAVFLAIMSTISATLNMSVVVDDDDDSWPFNPFTHCVNVQSVLILLFRLTCEN